MVLAFLFLIMPAFAASAEQPLPDTAQEARAENLFKQLRCVVCQSESISDSQADMARDMRQRVRGEVAAGKTDADIIKDLKGRYGDFILLKPPFQPNTWALWIAPLLFFGIAVAVVISILRRRRT